MKSCRRKTIVTSLIFLVSFLFGGCGSSMLKMSDTDTAMGTVVQSIVYVEDENTGKDALYEIGTTLQLYDLEVLSWRAAESEVAKLNATAGSEQGYLLEEWTGLEADLGTVWEISNKSDGALDVTIGPVTELWNLDKWATEDGAGFAVPDKEEIESLLQATGYEKVAFADNKIFLPAQMKLDLGAVGKGIVCDKIGEYLSEQSAVKAAIISVGGSVVTYGSKPDDSAWNVAIVHPREDGGYLGTLALKGNNYIATSGDYERYVEVGGQRYHHIMDPSTGYPANSGVCSVTIVSDSGLLCDALSTACFVLGVEKGMQLAEEYGAEALFVTEDLEITMTKGMETIFQPAEDN